MKLNGYMIYRVCLSLSLLIALAISFPATAKPIPERDITKLEEAFGKAGDERSTTAQRRAYKRVIRSGESLIRKYPDSDDRFKLLNLVFRSQRLLLEVDGSKELYARLINTAKALTEGNGSSWEEYIQKIAEENTPIKRFASPEELAHFFVFLCSPRASYCVGSTYYVDGGWLKVV